MSKGNSKRKASKPRRTSKPLSGRKSVQEANRKMLDFFVNQMTELRKFVDEFQGKVAQSNEQLWQNQNRQNEGLKVAEEHVVLLRRVLNDALGGVTRVTTIERRKEGSEELEEVQTIDWGWYGEQLHYSDDPQTFMNGVVLTSEEIKERAEKEAVKKRHNIVLYLAGKAAEKSEDELRKVYDEGDLDKHLQKFMPEKIEWEDAMHEIAPTIVEQVLQQRGAARKQKEKLEATRERLLLKNAITKLIAGGEEDVLKDGTPEQKAELVAGSMPTVVKWTDSMADSLENVIEEVFKEAEEAEAKRLKAMEDQEENDPEEVEAAAQELLEETKKFGEEAAGVIELIEAGKEDEARAAMDELEAKVKAKEAEAAKNAPHIPDGATVFGGS